MKTSQKIASVFLLAIFLVSSLGFTISSMVCLKSGKGKVSLSIIEDCCTKKQTRVAVETVCCNDDEESVYPDNVTVIKKGECCDINSFSFQLNDFQSAKKLSLDQPAVFNTLFHSSQVYFLTAAENKLSFQYSDLPPPLFGRSLLNYISILII